MTYRNGFVAGILFTSLSAQAELSVQAKLDCLTYTGQSKRASQDCVTLTEARLTVLHQFFEQAEAEISFDPLSTPVKTFSNYPKTGEYEIPGIKDRSTGSMDSFRLTWNFRKNLSLSLQTYSGATTIPLEPLLALHGSLQDSSWQQLALVAAYTLPVLEGAKVNLVIGNGEGEITRNLDPQRYGAFDALIEASKGIFLKMGLSIDGNSQGSEQMDWLYGDSYNDEIGFSTDRYSLGVLSDGQIPSFRGFKFALVWQRSRATDLNKETSAIPSELPYSEDSHYDVDNILVESEDSVNEIRRNVILVRASYLILDQYALAIGYEQRTIDTGVIPFFEACSSITDGQCESVQDPTSRLKQSAYAAGLSTEITEGLTFSLEYGKSSYNKLYRYFNFVASDKQKKKSRDVINARILYNFRSWN